MMLFLFDGRCVAPCFKRWMADMQVHSQTLEWGNPLKHMLNASRSSKPTPLFVICTFRILSCRRLGRLLDIEWNQKIESGNTALYVAAEYGHVYLVQFLLEKGINVESEGYYGTTALHRAVTAGHESVVSLLIEKGANVQAESGDGKTAFHRAADAGHEKLVRLLLQHGAKIEARSLYGKTAFFRAAENGHLDIVRLLLTRGADINTTSNDGSSALHKAAEYGHEMLTEILLQPYYSSQAIEINAKNNSGKTPLYLAVRAEHEVVVRLLLDAGAVVDGFGSYGESALYVAARNGNEIIVLLLLEKRPNFNVKASSGETALECATRMGHFGVVRLLKEHQRIDDAINTWSNLAPSGETPSEATQRRADGQESPIDVSSGLFGTPSRNDYSPQDFEILKLLNTGTDERHRLILVDAMLTILSGKNGKVYQVQERASQRIYAMKVWAKKVIVKKRIIVHVLGQRDLLIRGATARSPFIACLRFSFQTPTDLYLVTDFAGGGELSEYLPSDYRLPVDQAKFYLAELILAIEHLHEHDFDIYYFRSKDILLDSDGHVFLNNFQFSENMDEEERDIAENCSEYMAPEGPSYTRASVFWSLGALAFDMFCGWSPFYTRENMQLLKNIADGKAEIPSNYATAEEWIFIEGLLNREPKKRLGGTSGTEELKSHEFFLGVDWAAVARKELTPPLIPEDRSNDVQVYEETVSPLAAIKSRVGGLSMGSAPLAPSLQANFRGFTFVDDEPLHQRSELVGKELDYKELAHSTKKRTMKRIDSDDGDIFADGHYEVW